MACRASIEFHEAKHPVRAFETKFGGQPDWVNAPRWPLSRATGRPMRFVCQINLDPIIFGPIAPKMAYLFITDEYKEGEYVDGTWEPDGGENAVILQPGETHASVSNQATGPTVRRYVQKPIQGSLQPEPCEFTVTTVVSDDPEFADEDVRKDWTEEAWAQYAEALDGNKIGGNPLFLQSTEFPGPGKWRLLLQLDSTSVPFYVNFGDAGIGYAFLSEDGKTAKFLWQCA